MPESLVTFVRNTHGVSRVGDTDFARGWRDTRLGMLQFLSPLGWEHINLTGNYVWRQSRKVGAGRYRPLRDFKKR